MAGQLANAALEHAYDRFGEAGLIQINDVLNDVVAKGILDEDTGIFGDSLNEPELLIAHRMVDAALEHTAAVAMRADLDAVVTNRVKDELGILGRQLVEALLNDVVSVEILDELDHAETEGFDDEMNLLRSIHKLNHLLQRPRAVLVEGDAYHVLRRVLDQDSSLVVIAKLEELLAQIITKWVRHELDDVLVRLMPDQVNLLRVAFIKFLLEEAATVLVLAEVIDLANIGFKCHAIVARHCFKSGQRTLRWWDAIIGVLTFIVDLAAALHNACLAIAGLGVALVVGSGTVASIVLLLLVHGPVVGLADAHLAHPGTDDGDAVGATGSQACWLRGEAIGLVVAAVESRSRGVVGWCRSLDSGWRRNSRGAGTKGRGAGLKSRLNGLIGTSRFAVLVQVVVGHLAVVSARDSTGGNATQARVVVMEVLLRVIVGVGRYQGGSRRALNRGDVVGRVRALELGGRSTILASLRGHDGTARLRRILGDVLEIQRMAERRGSTLDARNIARLARSSVDRRHALLRAMAINHTAPASRRRFRIGRRGQGKV